MHHQRFQSVAAGRFRPVCVVPTILPTFRFHGGSRSTARPFSSAALVVTIYAIEHLDRHAQKAGGFPLVDASLHQPGRRGVSQRVRCYTPSKPASATALLKAVLTDLMGSPFRSTPDKQTHLERFWLLLMAMEELSVKTFGGPVATTRRTHGHGTQRGER
jgi:hypothetical protein